VHQCESKDTPKDGPRQDAEYSGPGNPARHKVDVDADVGDEDEPEVGFGVLLDHVVDGSNVVARRRKSK